MSHVSMFKPADTETGYIQCVIKPIYQAAFEKEGFVDNVDKLKKPRKRRVKKDDIKAGDS